MKPVAVGFPPGSIPAHRPALVIKPIFTLTSVPTLTPLSTSH